MKDVIKLFDNEKLKKAKYPVLKPDTEGQPLMKRINWLNLFKIELTTLLFLVAIILLMIGTKVTNEQCYQIIENPCETASKMGCVVLNITPMNKFNGTINYIPVN